MRHAPKTPAVRALIAAATAACALAVLGPATADASYTPQVDGAILRLNGDDQSDQIVVELGAANTIVFSVNGGPAQQSGGTTGTISQIVVDARGGDDQVTLQNGLPPGDLRGGDGNDTLRGGSSADVLNGGAGDDFEDGNIAADSMFGGPGDDVFQWDPGDGSDTIDGGDGNDVNVFNGSNIGEMLTLSPVAGTTDLSLTRNVAAINQTLRGVEGVRVKLIGGQDFFNASDNLAPTGLKTLDVDLGVD